MSLVDQMLMFQVLELAAYQGRSTIRTNIIQDKLLALTPTEFYTQEAELLWRQQVMEPQPILSKKRTTLSRSLKQLLKMEKLLPVRRENDMEAMLKRRYRVATALVVLSVPMLRLRTKRDLPKLR